MIDVEDLWQRASPASTVDIEEVLTLSPEDLILHLCLHTAVHHLYKNGLRGFCDIREIVRHYQDEMEWEKLMLRTREWGAENVVYLTLYLAKSLLDADVPDDFLDRIRPKSCTPQSVATAKEIIFSGLDKTVSINPYVAKVRVSKSAPKTAGLFLQRIFLSPATMSALYDISPDSLRILLYYPVRLKDLLVRHSRTVWRIWRKDKTTARQFHLIDWLSR